jgi:hypothetical protein
MISSTFFFLFSQLAVGMLLVLLFISPRVIGNSFFEFSSQTAAILMGVTLGFDFLFPSLVRESALPFVFLAVSAVLAGVYNRAVHIERYGPARALLIAAVGSGLVSIILDALAFTRLMELNGWEHSVLVVNHLAATGLLGSVMLTMVFGHWYLVVPKLSLDPLRLLVKVYMGAIVVRVVTIILSLVVLELQPEVSWSTVALELFVRQGLFFWPRVIFGVVLPIVLGLMIWSTVEIRHTQAATGLLYVAVVTLLFGEFFSKFLLWSVSVPL